ncbi:MAG TPA: bifunctional phosphopantothenoylcysteine decarboxylase/phosphopantothenate--cysteine ligase CoaBC [Acidobacteriota bacterium]|nr:bifunctional phosphopantothenoylcysteine decarboxylase/phosphopantothenate--cysteine ligase CoaBC [Acidobacteriota bacterium]
MEHTKGKQIVLGITGGIAAYKSAYLCRRLKEAGADVWVVMTRNGARFITPLTMETLSERPVLTEMFPAERYAGTEHIAVAGWADCVIIAPATANLIGKYAAGIADDLLSTILLATTAPVLLAPAMNTNMYLHDAVQENLATLRRRGVLFVDPGEGELACRTVGVGRMAEPDEIVRRVDQILAGRDKCDLLGHRVLVTAGPTVEPIDPVRVLTNRSSGKMGYALAEAAQSRGASVVLISGPTALPRPAGVTFVAVETAEEMCAAARQHFADASITIGVAAVSDWRVAEPTSAKLSKEDGPPRLRLEPTPDIMATLGEQKGNGQILVGFSLETDPKRLDSDEKLRRKNLDLLVCNNPTAAGSAFGGDTNDAVLIARDGERLRSGLLPKRELAGLILDQVVRLMAGERVRS